MRGGGRRGLARAIRLTDATASRRTGTIAPAAAGLARGLAGGRGTGCDAKRRRNLHEDQKDGEKRLHGRDGYFAALAGVLALSAASVIFLMYLAGSFLKSFSQDLQQSFTS